MFSIRERSRHSGAPVTLFLFRGSDDSSPIGPFGFNNGETAFTREGIFDRDGVTLLNFEQWPVKHSKISSDGTLDKSDLTITMALGSNMDDLFLAFPPSQVVNVTVFEGHVGDELTAENFPAIWYGRIIGAGRKDNELELTCEPVNTSLRRAGLRRNYQLGCPHALYGPQCKANKASATIVRSAASTSGNTILVDTNLSNPERFLGGMVEWENETTGRKEFRTISGATIGGITVRGPVRGVVPGTTLSVSRGCNHQMSGCALHNNIHNFGGQPFIPLENPLSQKSQFY